ncbi:phage minor head protein [Sagittula salina]|uniref:Phage head morphogenesis domain-containing protein n=1 Tax=Sagittula salina TaxID=2820268 RepID=A0A940S2C6_9RHOB|nr:phage minor head protein [Sagittula salina]MBP0483951.1 hypothetical protein [Sagittula salina]
MAELSGVFHQPFGAQVAAWRERLGTLLPTSRWTDVWHGEHDHAFMVAGALKADLLGDLAAAVGKAIEDGTSIEEFRRDFRATVARRGWHGWTGEGTKAGEAWRTRVIYTTNLRSTYAAGRFAQLVDGGFPFWVYRHSGAAEPREQHLAWDGLILPSDHPFWFTHFPPNGWGCGCYVVGARSIKDAMRKGGNPMVLLGDDWNTRDPKTGEPEGIDKGWGYAPGRTVVEQVRAAVAAKVATLPQPLASDLASSIENPPPPRPPELREAKNLKDTARLVVEAGIAEKEVAWPGKVQLDAVNQVIRTLWDLKHRFEMVPLQAVGSATLIARATAGLRSTSKAHAWYAPRVRAMGWDRSGLEFGDWWEKGGWAKLPLDRRLAARDRKLDEYRRLQAKGIERLPEGAAKQAAQRAHDAGLWQFTVDYPGDEAPRGVAVHETGHQLHFSHWTEINDAIHGWNQQGWHLAVSKYGSSNAMEFVAESFVLYNLGPEHHWRIKPELLAVFKAKDRWNV